MMDVPLLSAGSPNSPTNVQRSVRRLGSVRRDWVASSTSPITRLRGTAMPSASLLNWQTMRIPNLGHVDAQCAACIAAVPQNPALIDENQRAYVLLLSAHFQGFCRDLHTECAQ